LPIIEVVVAANLIGANSAIRAPGTTVRSEKAPFLDIED